jgi:hypothetical protein
VALVGHLVRHDQVMLGVDRGLHVVAHDARAAAARGHRACIGVGQRQLLIRLRPRVARPTSSSFFICSRTVAIFSLSRSTLASGTSDGSRSADRAPTGSAAMLCSICCCRAFELVRREVLVAIVHCLELAAVDRHQRLLEQAELAAQQHELPARVADRHPVVAAEVGDRLEVRRQAPGQPDQLEVALALALQAPARGRRFR